MAETARTPEPSGPSKDCIFCKIVRGEVPSHLVYADDRVVAFPDAHPQAPVHLLVIPREHIADLDGVDEGDEPLLGHMLTVAKTVAAQEGIQGSGYRLAMNLGPDAGQRVFHIHLHVMGGRRLGRMG